MSLRDQLQAIYDQRGQLTPKIVVDEARDEEHPLHDRFEWDDAIGGEKWRLHQAHDMIVSIKVSYTDPDGKPQEMRHYQPIRNETGFVYEPTEEVIQDELMARVLLADMEREWRTLKKRFDQFREFRQMVLDDLGKTAA